ncbi:hypothetical protein Tco_0180419 [Tanacetum coccineum]
MKSGNSHPSSKWMSSFQYRTEHFIFFGTTTDSTTNYAITKWSQRPAVGTPVRDLTVATLLESVAASIDVMVKCDWIIRVSRIKALEKAICVVIRLICVWKSWRIDLRYSFLLEDLEAVPAGLVPAGHVLISADRYRIC